MLFKKLKISHYVRRLFLRMERVALLRRFSIIFIIQVSALRMHFERVLFFDKPEPKILCANPYGVLSRELVHMWNGQGCDGIDGGGLLFPSKT